MCNRNSVMDQTKLRTSSMEDVRFLVRKRQLLVAPHEQQWTSSRLWWLFFRNFSCISLTCYVKYIYLFMIFTAPKSWYYYYFSFPPSGIGNDSQVLRFCLGPLACLLPTPIKLFCFQIYCLWAYMKVIKDTRRTH